MEQSRIADAEQLNLPGLDPAPQPLKPRRTGASHTERATHRLFFGLFPSAPNVGRIAGNIPLLRRSLRLNGSPLKPDRLHITLLSLGDYVGAVPQMVIDCAMDAAKAAVGPPLDILFDRVMSFPGSGAFVLCGADRNPAVAALGKRLSAALKHAGLQSQVSNRPHMTLLYSDSTVTEHAVTPISWAAAEFVLVLSHLGKTHHQKLARWPLVPWI
jgi:RNA 2',3'-cyclic 3'-phosphodiesterase